MDSKHDEWMSWAAARAQNEDENKKPGLLQPTPLISFPTSPLPIRPKRPKKLLPPRVSWFGAHSSESPAASPFLIRIASRSVTEIRWCEDQQRGHGYQWFLFAPAGRSHTAWKRYISPWNLVESYNDKGAGCTRGGTPCKGRTEKLWIFYANTYGEPASKQLETNIITLGIVTPDGRHRMSMKEGVPVLISVHPPPQTPEEPFSIHPPQIPGGETGET